MDSVVLKPGKDKAVRNRHHWIFSGAVKSLPDFENGSLLPVRSADGELLGHAYFNRKSSIAGRMVSFGDTPPQDAIRQNVDYLRGLARSGRWPLLRRNPPVFTVLQNPMQGVRVLLITHLKELWGAPPAVSVH